MCSAQTFYLLTQIWGFIMNRLYNLVSGVVAMASAAVLSLVPAAVLASPALDLTPITDVLEEGPGYVTTLAGALFLTIGLIFVLAKIRQIIKA